LNQATGFQHPVCKARLPLAESRRAAFGGFRPIADHTCDIARRHEAAGLTAAPDSDFLERDDFALIRFGIPSLLIF